MIFAFCDYRAATLNVKRFAGLVIIKHLEKTSLDIITGSVSQSHCTNEYNNRNETRRELCSPAKAFCYHCQAERAIPSVTGCTQLLGEGNDDL